MDIDRIDRIVERHGGVESSLIQVLLDIQAEYHWLPAPALERVSQRMGVPMTRIRHIATFYKAFSLTPRGRHEVHLCMGTACHVRGATRVLDSIREVTGIEPGETDVDMNFSLETVNCLGCCALGPVMEVDGETYGKLSPDQAAKVLEGYRTGSEHASD